MNAINVIARDIIRNSFNHAIAATPQKTVESQDEAQAGRIADVLASASRGTGPTSNGAPLLESPSRPPANKDELAMLAASLSIGMGGADAGAIQNAFSELSHSAILALDPDVQKQIQDAGGTVPDSLMATAPFVAVQQNLKALIGLVSPDGSMAYPSIEDLAAISGRTSSATFEQTALGALLSDAPLLKSLIEEAGDMSDEELPVRLHTDPRFAYVLMLVAFLMKLAASQREVAASMLVFAEKSIQDMGARMVDSAKQQQLAKVVSLAVVVVVSAVAVSVATTAAVKNVNSIRSNQVKANGLNKDAAEMDVKLAKGYTTGAYGTNGRAVSQDQRMVLGKASVDKRNQAAELMATHNLNATQSAVLTQTGQVVGQSANATGNVAGSGHEITAAELTAQQEKRRVDSSTGQQTSQAIVQSAGKADESSTHLFQQAAQAEQERSNTRDEIARHIR